MLQTGFGSGSGFLLLDQDWSRTRKNVSANNSDTETLVLLTLIVDVLIRDEYGSGLVGLQFFWKLADRTGSDWQNFSCIFVIILNISKVLVVIRFCRFAKWDCILPWMAIALLRQFFISNCIHLCEHITLSSSSTWIHKETILGFMVRV